MVGFLVVLVLLVGCTVAMRAALDRRRATERAVGASDVRPWRRTGLSYRGDHPDLPRAIKRCRLVVSSTQLGVEDRTGIALRVPLDHVLRVRAERGPETPQQHPLSWMIFGLWTLLTPRFTRTLQLTVETREGTMTFDKAKALPDDEVLPANLQSVDPRGPAPDPGSR